MSDVHNAEVVLARVPVWRRVDPKQDLETHTQACLFHHFPARAVFDGLAVVDEAAWQRPALGFAGPLDQDDATVDFDDDVRCGVGVSVRCFTQC